MISCVKVIPGSIPGLGAISFVQGVFFCRYDILMCHQDNRPERWIDTFPSVKKRPVADDPANRYFGKLWITSTESIPLVLEFLQIVLQHLPYIPRGGTIMLSNTVAWPALAL